MKHKLIALTMLLFSYANDMDINASAENADVSSSIESIIIKQLNNLEKTLQIDEASLALIKKYSLKGEYDSDTREAIRVLCEKFKIEEAWFYQLIDLESNGNPQAVNDITGASGIIQFMPTTAKALGISIEDIRKMTVSEQLPWVDKYLTKIKGSREFTSFLDLYFAVFYPRGIGQPHDYVIGSEVSEAYAKKIREQNKGIDKAGDNDGLLTPSDIAEWAS